MMNNPQRKAEKSLEKVVERQLELPEPDLALNLFGANDKNIRIIEDRLDVKITARYDELHIRGFEKKDLTRYLSNTCPVYADYHYLRTMLIMTYAGWSFKTSMTTIGTLNTEPCTSVMEAGATKIVLGNFSEASSHTSLLFLLLFC